MALQEHFLFQWKDRFNERCLPGTLLWKHFLGHHCLPHGNIPWTLRLLGIPTDLGMAEQLQMQASPSAWRLEDVREERSTSENLLVLHD